jgi:hypothetical protein
MFSVQFELQGGRTCSFQIPCRFAGCVPGRLLAIRRYRPYWNSSSTSRGSFAPAETIRSSSSARPP